MATIYLFSAPPDDEVFVREIARLTEKDFALISNPDELADKLKNETSILFISDKTDESLVQTLDSAIKQFYSEPHNLNRIHYIVTPERLNLNEPKLALFIPSGGNYVIRNFNEKPEAAAEVYSRVIRVTAKDRAFGLHNLFSDGTPISKYSMQHSSERGKIVSSAEKFFMDTGADGRLSSLAANAADELLMNAIFDAPFENNQRKFHNSTSRTAEFPLEKDHPVELYVGTDKDYIGISVVDYYGSVDRDAIFAHFTRNLKKQPFQPNPKVQHNGLGLALMFKMGASFLVSSDRNRRTEVFILMKKTVSYRQFKNQLQFVATQIYMEDAKLPH